jgi:hypothetical protein
VPENGLNLPAEMEQFDLPAQTLHVHIEGARPDAIGIAPNGLEQIIPGQAVAGVLAQDAQQLGLFSG